MKQDVLEMKLVIIETAKKKAILWSYSAVPVLINADKEKQEELSALTMNSNNALKTISTSLKHKLKDKCTKVDFLKGRNKELES